MSEVLIAPSRYKESTANSPGPVSDRESYEDWETSVNTQLFLRADRYGWAGLPQLWEYNAANQIIGVNAGDVTNRIEAGTKLRFKQPASSNFVYGYVTSVSGNLVNIATSSTATLSNAILNEVGFSRGVSPVGFPRSLSFTSSLAAVAPLTISGLTVTYSHFCVTDRWLTLALAASFTSTNTGTALSFTAPVASATTGAPSAGCGHLIDATVPYALAVSIASASSTVTVTAIQRTFAAGNSYSIYLGLTYPI